MSITSKMSGIAVPCTHCQCRPYALPLGWQARLSTAMLMQSATSAPGKEKRPASRRERRDRHPARRPSRSRAFPGNDPEPNLEPDFVEPGASIMAGQIVDGRVSRRRPAQAVRAARANPGRRDGLWRRWPPCRRSASGRGRGGNSPRACVSRPTSAVHHHRVHGSQDGRAPARRARVCLRRDGQPAPLRDPHALHGCGAGRRDRRSGFPRCTFPPPRWRNAGRSCPAAGTESVQNDVGIDEDAGPGHARQRRCDPQLRRNPGEVDRNVEFCLYAFDRAFSRDIVQIQCRGQVLGTGDGILKGVLHRQPQAVLEGIACSFAGAQPAQQADPLAGALFEAVEIAFGPARGCTPVELSLAGHGEGIEKEPEVSSKLLGEQHQLIGLKPALAGFQIRYALPVVEPEQLGQAVLRPVSSLASGLDAKAGEAVGERLARCGWNGVINRV